MALLKKGAVIFGGKKYILIGAIMNKKDFIEYLLKLGHYSKKELKKKPDSELTALFMQSKLLSQFTYVSEEEKFGVGERFDRDVEQFIKGDIVFGDCDMATSTITEVAVRMGWAKPKDLINMTTPNHYIGGVIDRKKGEVWVYENTGYEYTKKALNSADFPIIISRPIYQNFKDGYIIPRVYKLSDLQKGVIIQEKRGNAFMIGAKVKQYKMEIFRTHDEALGNLWWTSADDLPFIHGFKENQSLDGVVPAENINSKKRYTFTKKWLKKTVFARVKKDNDMLIYDRLEELKELNKSVKYKYSNRSLKRLSKVDRDLSLLYMDLANYFDIMIVSGFRTAEKQNKLFKKGMSSKDGYNKISKHQEGLAVDAIVVHKNLNMYIASLENNLRWAYFNGFLKAIALKRGIRIKSGWKWREDPFSELLRPISNNTLVDSSHVEKIN